MCHKATSFYLLKKFKFLWNILAFIVDIHCRLLTAPRGSRDGASHSKITLRAMALWCTVRQSPCVVIHHQSVEYYNAPQILGVDAGVHQTLSNACKEWVWVARLAWYAGWIVNSYGCIFAFFLTNAKYMHFQWSKVKKFFFLSGCF